MNSSRITEYRLPCPFCTSSDAFHLYDDGHGYCFSCHHRYTPLEDIQNETNNKESYTYQHIPYRRISPTTFKFFGIEAKCKGDGTPIAFAFPQSDTGAFKIRDLTKPKRESFRITADDPTVRSQPTLVGSNKFPAGSANAITIVEGDFDLPATYEMLGSKYPVVSVRSSATARQDCEALRDYLNSFGKIYLAFDGDQAGKDAKQHVASLFDFNKVYDVVLPDGRDPDDLHQAAEDKLFRQLWYNAKRFLPEGIVSSFQEFDEIIDGHHAQPIASFPFPTLESLSYGIRGGEVILLTALEGIGKTEYLRAIEHHILKTTDHNIGIIHLEESKDRSLKGLTGYELGVPCHIPDFGVDDETIKESLRKLLKRDERLHLYSHFDTDDPDIILDRIRFLVTVCGCRIIFLDHITFLATSLAEADTVKFLDYLSTRLEKLTETHDFALVLVSHENDNGDTRGSKNISKTATFRIRLERNIIADNEQERNTTTVTVLKNRYGAQTGPAGKLYFDPSSFKIHELTKLDELKPLERKDDD